MATSFQNAIDKIKQVVTTGLGQGSRIVTAGYFDMTNFWDNKNPDKLAKDVLQGPQVNVYVGELKNANAYSTLATEIQYTMQVFIEIGYNLRNDLIEADRQTAKILILDDVHSVQRALSHPNNLSDSGIASEMLVFIKASPVTFDWEELHMALVTLEFVCEIFIED